MKGTKEAPQCGFSNSLVQVGGGGGGEGGLPSAALPTLLCCLIKQFIG